MFRRLTLATLLLSSVSFVAACKSKAASDSSPILPSRNNPNTSTSRVVQPRISDGGSMMPVVVTTATRARTAARTAKANEVVRVPAGNYHLGSTPGDEGRDPGLEADGQLVQLPAFDIDALPYPNDPAQPMRLGASRAEAEEMCKAKGRRLCTEIEWERACRGADETIFPGGDTWDANTCGGRGDPGQCASGYGALIMGARNAEWTRDNIEDRGVIRGAQASAEPRLHRCASRRSLYADQPGADVAFRCCGGAVPNIAYPREAVRVPFRPSPLSAGEVSKIMEQVPELNWLRPGLTMYSPGAVTAVMNHGATSVDKHPEVLLSAQPLIWSPTLGEEILAFVANSNVGSFVVALYVLPPKSTAEGGDGRTPRYRHAGSFVLAREKADLALAYGMGNREVLYWHACFNCPGEYGTLDYNKETARVSIVQR